MPIIKGNIAKAPAKARGRPKKQSIISHVASKRAARAQAKEDNGSEDEGEAIAAAPEAHRSRNRKRDASSLEDEEVSGSEAEDDQEMQQQQQEAAAADQGKPQSKRKSAMDLVSGRLDEETLKKIVRDLSNDPSRLEMAARAQSELTRLEGHKWRFLMTRGGHSLLFYGFGSKMDLLEKLARDVLVDGAVLAVHGYRPTIKAKHAVHAVASVALPPGQILKGISTPDLIRMIHTHQSKPPTPISHPPPRIYLLVHNIDGPGLRPSSEQALLADLSRCPRVHLLASMDHINAPAMWDVGLRARFGFRYQEVTTHCPYLKETLDVQPILLTSFHQNATRGATTALGSMALNAQAVFRVLAEAQLDDPESPGITLPTLFRMCRERWLVSSEQALRGFLAEFYDHELVSQRVGGEEQREVLYVPMEEEALRRLLSTLKNPNSAEP